MADRNYTLNVNNIHDLEDVKDILEAMNLQMRVREDSNPTAVQQRLIDGYIFKLKK